MELTYHRRGDYPFPNLILEPEEPVVLGKYGNLRRTFLREHKQGVYQALLLDGGLNKHLAEIEESANDYPYDNACIESFDRAYTLIFEYIEAFYNTVRIHSHCDHMSPEQYERLYQRVAA